MVRVDIQSASLAKNQCRSAGTLFVMSAEIRLATLIRTVMISIGTAKNTSLNESRGCIRPSRY